MSKPTEPPERYSPNWLQSMDGRTVIAQELRQRHRALTDDLGGAETLSYPQRSLIERVLFLEFHLQQEEQKLATGAEFDSAKWVQACNSMLGIYNKLGLKRAAKTVPQLQEYVKGGKQ